MFNALCIYFSFLFVFTVFFYYFRKLRNMFHCFNKLVAIDVKNTKVPCFRIFQIDGEKDPKED
jgi:hypothetical protein